MFDARAICGEQGMTHPLRLFDVSENDIRSRSRFGC